MALLALCTVPSQCFLHFLIWNMVHEIRVVLQNVIQSLLLGLGLWGSLVPNWSFLTHKRKKLGKKEKRKGMHFLWWYWLVLWSLCSLAMKIFIRNSGKGLLWQWILKYRFFVGAEMLGHATAWAAECWLQRTDQCIQSHTGIQPAQMLSGCHTALCPRVEILRPFTEISTDL